MSAESKIMPKKKTAKATKKVKLEEMNQTDGMVQGEKYEHSSLDQVWGDDGTDKYKTLDIATYEKVLANMSKSDLKNEAIRVGLLPIDNLDQLRQRLSREFNAHVASYKKPQSSGSGKPVQLYSDDVMKILGEGK